MRLFHSSRRYVKGILALFFYSAIGTSTVGAMDFMPVSEVSIGMEGYAKTVVQGNDLSTFDVKVLGVLKDKGPSGDLILARFSGPLMEETGGIVHGMSGSPVYINGKLVGAVAYGWGFTDGKLGMITPIEQMTALWNIPYQKDLPNPWKNSQLIPLGTPFMAEGFDEPALAYMDKKFEAFGYKSYETASSPEMMGKQPLEPGGSVSALLVKGDVKLGAIGTVTYVDGDKMVAFGHSFLKRGNIDYFMNNSYIFTVVKSMNSGFKLGSMGEEVGSIVEDRGAGIAGVQGQQLAGLPVSIGIKDKDTGRIRRHSITMIEHQDLSPTLLATSVYTLVNKALDRYGGGTAKVTLTINPNASDIEPLHRVNWFYSSRSIAEKSIDEMYDILESLMKNTFKDYPVRDIAVDIEVQEEKRTARIVEAEVDHVIVAPGDEITVNVELQTHRHGKINRQVLFKVPKEQALGDHILEVRGGGITPLPYLLKRQQYNLTDEIIRRIQKYKDFDEYYKAILEEDANHQIVVEILEDNVSMIDDSKEKGKKKRLEFVETSNVPDSKKNKLDGKDTWGDGDEGPDPTRVDTDYVILGDGQFNLQVVPADKRDAARAKRKKEKLERVKATIQQDTQDTDGEENGKT